MVRGGCLHRPVYQNPLMSKTVQAGSVAGNMRKEIKQNWLQWNIPDIGRLP